MAIVRRNILADPATLQRFAEGVNRLKADFSSGVTTQTLGFSSSQPIPVSAYDQFVIWHFVAMNIPTPDPQGLNPRDRNAAHRGSIFLPWHRFMLRLFELHLQRVLEDPEFGLPYWDWAFAENTPFDQQVNSALWQETGIGGSGFPVIDGPFGFSEDPQQRRFAVFFAQDLWTGTFTFYPTAAGCCAGWVRVRRLQGCRRRCRSPRRCRANRSMTHPIGTPRPRDFATSWKVG